MLSQTSYQLQSYKIVEQGNLVIHWEKHSGFSVQQSGHCWIFGNILIIGKPISENIGCLVGEFFDQLEKLPPWTKTKYYCKESGLFLVSPVKARSEEDRSKSVNLYSTLRRSKQSPAVLTSGYYRLGAYRIAVDAEVNIIWQKYIANGKVASGVGEICNDILLLTEKTFEENQDRKQFQNKLKSLPLWPFTEAYVPYGAVILCSGKNAKTISHVPSPILRQKYIKKTSSSLRDKNFTKAEFNSAPSGASNGDLLGPMLRETRNDTDSFAFFTSKFSSSILKLNVAFIKNIISGKGAYQKERFKGIAHQTKASWKSKIVSVLIIFLAVVTFLAIFFHHEIDSFAHLAHHDGHYHAHHSNHRSNH